MFFGLIKGQKRSKLEEQVTDERLVLAQLPAIARVSAKNRNFDALYSTTADMVKVQDMLNEQTDEIVEDSYADGVIDGALVTTGVFGIMIAVGLAVFRKMF